MLKNERSAGVLCHISSLPGKYGIGSLGKEAYEFVDFLSRAHVKYWQILPLVQTGYGDSPYQSVYSNSGNPYFIDLEQLFEEGLIDKEELKSCEDLTSKVDYEKLYKTRYNILRIAYARFDIKTPEFVEFIDSGEFEDYALFMSLKSKYHGSFDTFPDAYKYKEHLAMYEFRTNVYKSDYCFWLFVQFMFKKQWMKLKKYANSLGIKIIGDIPLYVAYDSADVWGRPELFMLDSDLKPTMVAGVPPDYFSPTGQLWGNPLYNWELMAADKFSWWVDRVKKASKMYDALRIDHFRGLDRYYAIPADATTAEEGEWLYGPNKRLFDKIYEECGDLEIIAEDLGIIDGGVVKLRDKVGLPGMKILQFAFDGKLSNPYLPNNIEENTVVYTGTHDNDTTLGFLESMTPSEYKTFTMRFNAALESASVYTPYVTKQEAVLVMCELACACASKLAILPIQDLLKLGSESRMNTPGTSGNNWQFKLTKPLSRQLTGILRRMIKAGSRG